MGWIRFAVVFRVAKPEAGPVYVRHPVHAAQHMHDIPCQIWIAQRLEGMLKRAASLVWSRCCF